jgi:hypothetical protein
MNNIFNKNFKFYSCLYLFLLFFYNECFSSTNTKTIISPISQGALLYIKYHKPFHIDESCCSLKFNFNTTYLFENINNSDNLAKTLFNSNPIYFCGDINEFYNRPNNALIPEYFGLSNDTQTSVLLSPRIKNQIIDLQISIGYKKFWIQVNAPIIYSNWQINSGTQPLNQIGVNNLDSDKKITMQRTIINGDPYLLSASLLPPSNTGLDEENYPLNGYIINNSDNNASYFQYSNNATKNVVSSIAMGQWQKPVFTTQYDKNLSPNSTIPIELTLTNEAQTVLNAPPLVVPPGTQNNSILNITQNQVSTATSINEALNEFTFGDVPKRIYGNFNFVNNSYSSAWGIADLQLQLGFEAIECKNQRLGIYFKFFIPTGTSIDKNSAKNVFSPIIGNGRHFAPGIGLSFDRNLINLCNDSSLNIALDGYIVHLFGSSQFRVFDKYNLPMSRYAILKILEYDYLTSGIKYSDIFKYIGMTPLININNGYVNIWIDIMGEFIADLSYKSKKYEIGIGYSFTGQSAEKCNPIGTNFYSNNGIINSKDNIDICYGFKGNTFLTDMLCDTTVTNGSTILTPLNTTFMVKTNGSVTKNGKSGAYSYGESTETINSEGTTIEDVFLLPCINNSGLMNAQILNKIFAHFDYTFESLLYNPSIHIIGAYGFSPINYITPAYWDIGLQFSFNF